MPAGVKPFCVLTCNKENKDEKIIGSAPSYFESVPLNTMFIPETGSNFNPEWN
jgi:hypothetical protein